MNNLYRLVGFVLLVSCNVFAASGAEFLDSLFAAKKAVVEFRVKGAEASGRHGVARGNPETSDKDEILRRLDALRMDEKVIEAERALDEHVSGAELEKMKRVFDAYVMLTETLTDLSANLEKELVKIMPEVATMRTSSEFDAAMKPLWKLLDNTGCY